LAGKPKYSKKTCPNAGLSIKNSTYCPDEKPGRRCGKTPTNRLSYGTALIKTIYFSRRLSVPEDILQLLCKECNIQLGVTFGRRMAWKHHIERTVAKALRAYVGTYSLFEIERLSIDIKLTISEALFRSLMNRAYASPTWEYAADAHIEITAALSE
jgi:hypothetical protein